MITFIWALGTMMNAVALAMTFSAMNEDCNYSTIGNLSIAFIVSAGFVVFPFINIFTSVWLFNELYSAYTVINKRNGKK